MTYINKKIFQTGLGLIVLLSMQFNANAEVAQTGNYKIDPSHSTILFKANHLGFSDLTGRFNTFEGSFTLNKSKSNMNVSIQSNSIDTNHEKRDNHLRSPDFFNVKQFPSIQFKSKKVTVNKQGEPVTIKGELFLHGKSNVVTFAVSPVGAGKDPWGGYRAGYNATATIKRSDYGMNFMVGGGISDDIEIILNIETMKQ